MFNNGYPTNKFNLVDGSGASTTPLFSAPDSGLNVPFAFIMAERGVPGAINFGGSAEHTPVFGSATFDPTSPYYNAATVFIETQMAGQGVELMRLVDPAAETASLGLFLSVTHQLVPQYKKDSTGARLVDGTGHFEPKTLVDGVTPVTEAGVVIKWSVRELASNESFDALVNTTVTNGAVVTVTYPILAVQLTSPGAYGSRQGFSFYSTGTKDTTVAQAINSVLYRFAPVALPTSVSTTASAIADVFGAPYNDVSFKNSAIYAGTATNYAFNSVLNNSYVDQASGDSSLPYLVHVYGANVGIIGAAVVAVSPELVGTDPYMIDLMACTDLNGNLYDHVELDAASTTVVNSAVINYAQGGTDGDTSWTMYESLVADFLAGSDFGEFGNLQQHPMTHFSDPGFSMPTKMLLFNMLDLRDNFKIDTCTQDIMLPANTKAEDISAGQTLSFRAQMHPESVINGVGCMRVGVYAHASTLATGSSYSGLVPFNLQRAVQRRNLDGGTYVRGSAGGLPNSQVTLFRKPNWVADDDASQQLSWSNAINTVRHATRSVIYYPAYRTVYPNDTSLLVDDEFSDRVVYIYKIVRAVYATYAGVKDSPKNLFKRIQNDINNRCAAAFSGDNINVQATVFQTATDANLGYALSANIAVTGSPSMRQINFNVSIGRATV